MKCLILAVVFGLIGCSLASKIDQEIFSKLEKNEPVNVLVKFVGADIDGCYKKLEALNLIGEADIVKNLVNILVAQAELIQAPVIAALKSAGIVAKSSQVWITGELVMYAASKALIDALEKNPAVESVAAEKFLVVSQDTQLEVTPNNTQWGVEKIDASYAWKDGNEGMNVVVGIIDTGTLYTHEALRENYRGWKGEKVPAEHDYNWFDATAISENRTPNKTPVDHEGHGTHVTGTICGNKKNIGVAPKAKWISCSATTGAGLSTQALLLCAQFMLCPRDVNNENRNCEKRAHVINNSWGSVGGERWFDDVVRGWNKAGIVSFFSAGNDGNTCGNVGSPADGKDTVAVGSTDMDDKISDFSSVGPSKEGVLKPDLSAPGSAIVSAWPTGDNKYASLSGTSMASPHASGTAALIVGYFKKNNIKYTVADVINAMKDGAQPTKPTMTTCNGIKDDIYPNNFVGVGRINAKTSLSKDIISKYGNKGTSVAGKVIGSLLS